MESTTTRKTFAFNTVWYEIIKDCSALVKGEVFEAVMEYALYGKLPEGISNEANVIFQFIKIEIDRREKRRQKAIAAKSATLPSTDKSDRSDSSDNSDNSETPSTPILSRQLRRKLKREEEKRRKRLKAA